MTLFAWVFAGTTLGVELLLGSIAYAAYTEVGRLRTILTQHGIDDGLGGAETTHWVGVANADPQVLSRLIAHELRNPGLRA